MILNAGPAWAEAHTRRSNLDVVAAFLSHNASAGDLILVQDVWEGITFNRYYRGRARWLSVPPIDSHEVHGLRSGNGSNEPTGGDDSGATCDNQYSDQRPRYLGGGEHTHRAFKECVTRANSAAAPAVRNAHPMVDGIVFPFGGTNRLQRSYWITRSKESLKQLLRPDYR